jgi:hypothetical protein
MTVQELVAHFPKVPGALHEEPLLARFAEAFDGLLRVAREPSPCSTEHDAANHDYLKLVGPLAIHGYGLSTREKVLAQIQDLLDRQAANPDDFAAGLLPADMAAAETRGPGCS